jgi:hypothetical protein
MITKIISGGQTGVDQAGWRAAKAASIPTGGHMPKDFLTEDGPRPEFAEDFGAVELDTDSYEARTEENVRQSDGTIWFGATDSPGSKVTLWACEAMGKPVLIVRPSKDVKPSCVAAWIRKMPRLVVLNIAGSRESKAPGIGARVEAFLTEAFRQLAIE